MDTRNANIERRIELGLLVVFGCVALGALRSVGLLGRTSPTAKPLSDAAGPLAKLPELLQRYHERMTDTLPTEPRNAAGAVGTGGAGVRYTASGLRDPLVSLLPEAQPAQPTVIQEPVVAAPPPQPPSVTVQGMIWGGRRPQVLIDNRLYNVGDTVQAAQIVAIAREGVTVMLQGTTFLLSPRRGLSTPARSSPPSASPLEQPIGQPPLFVGPTPSSPDHR